MSFDKTSTLLQDVLPIGLTHNKVTVRNHLHRVAKRQEVELEEKPRFISGCANDWAKLPKPDKPLVVGIDGGYVRSCKDRKINFEVIVGKSFSKSKPAKRFGLVQSMDKKPQRRLLHVLRERSAKWYLWHGNVEKAQDCLEDCYCIAIDEDIHYKEQKKLIRYLEELVTYIDNNSHLIPNYGERWRYGETVSSSFVESTVNEVVTKRMVKKQQMQWSQRGAHYLLQTRTATLSGDLGHYFERWYPGISIANDGNERSSDWEKAA